VNAPDIGTKPGSPVAPAAPQPQGPPIVEPRNFDHQEASPGDGAAGSAGATADTIQGQGQLWQAAVAQSDAPEEVRQRLLSKENIDYVRECQTPVKDLRGFRTVMASQGFYNLDEAIAAVQSKEKVQSLISIINSYVKSCVRPLSSLPDGNLRVFAETRVGVLLDPSGKPFCTATLIASNWILTAHHCLRKSSTEWIDFGQILFKARPDGIKEWESNLEAEIFTSEYYRNPDGSAKLYETGLWSSDYVLVKLRNSFSGTPALSYASLGTAVPSRFDATAAVMYSDDDRFHEKECGFRRYA
jgi:hypothetical protein